MRTRAYALILSPSLNIFHLIGFSSHAKRARLPPVPHPLFVNYSLDISVTPQKATFKTIVKQILALNAILHDAIL